MDDAADAYSRLSPKREPRDVLVKRSRTGKGVFAKRRFRTDVVIGEIEGLVIADPLYGSEYCFDLEDGSFLEPSPPFRFLNHSCEPNCEFQVLDLADELNPKHRRRLMLIATDDIKPGDQLTIDYNWPVEGAIHCRCGSPSCRQWVVAETELDALLARNA